MYNLPSSCIANIFNFFILLTRKVRERNSGWIYLSGKETRSLIKRRTSDTLVPNEKGNAFVFGTVSIELRQYVHLWQPLLLNAYWSIGLQVQSITTYAVVQKHLHNLTYKSMPRCTVFGRLHWTLGIFINQWIFLELIRIEQQCSRVCLFVFSTFIHHFHLIYNIQLSS